MKRGSFQRSAIIILAIALLLILGAMTKLFLIGEPIDGRQVHCTLSLSGQNLELHVAPAESDMALRGWEFKQDGSTLFISGRKVLVSPLFSEGYYEASIDIKSIDHIYLGGQAIWQRI